MQALKQRIALVLIVISGFAIVFLLAIYPSLRSRYIESVIIRYDQITVGMQEAEVIRLLGRPRIKTRIRSADLEPEIITTHIIDKELDDIKRKYTLLTIYSYWIPNLPLLRRPSMQVGRDIYINDHDSSVVLIRRR